MTLEDREQLAAIINAPDVLSRVRLIKDYWRDGDRADRTPREYLYLHLRFVVATLDHLIAEIPTFEILVVAGRAAIKCRFCGRISELPGDVENRYCGRCHLFHDVVSAARVQVAGGGTHDCGEWQTGHTARPVCALCGATLGPPTGPPSTTM